MLPQCHRKTRASTNKNTPRKRTQGAGQQIFQVTRLRQVVGWLRAVVFVSFFNFLFFFSLSLSRGCENQVTRSQEDCAKHQTKCTTPCVAQCVVFIDFSFFLEPPSWFDRRVFSRGQEMRSCHRAARGSRCPKGAFGRHSHAFRVS